MTRELMFWIWLGSIVAFVIGLMAVGFWLSTRVERGKP